MLPLHPKIMAALLAAVATIIVQVAAAVAEVYPDAPWLPIVSALVPVIVGYLKSAPAPPLPLREGRLARLFDQDDDYADLSVAEVKAIEDAGRSLQSDLRGAIADTHQVYVRRVRGGD